MSVVYEKTVCWATQSGECGEQYELLNTSTDLVYAVHWADL